MVPVKGHFGNLQLFNLAKSEDYSYMTRAILTKKNEKRKENQKAVSLFGIIAIQDKFI